MKFPSSKFFCVSVFQFSELFPTKWSGLIFFLYITLFICQGLIVTSSQNSGHSYAYNTVLVVLLVEMLKLAASFVIFCTRYNVFMFFKHVLAHIKLLWLYLIPAFLYCLYNNLSFINLLNYDPSTYSILLQLRVVITGILFQILFKKYLTKIQWLSLILLTIGCMLKNVEFDFTGHAILNSATNITLVHHKSDSMGLDWGTIWIFLQLLCSCFASVYIEYLLKNDGLHVDIFIQNSFLYFDSIICNILVLVYQWDMTLFSQKSWENILDLKVLLVLFNNAAVGIVASFFLKYLNSILKTIASALELVFIAVLAWIIFNVPIKDNAMASIFVVIFSIILYSRNPVQNPAHSDIKKKELVSEA